MTTRRCVIGLLAFGLAGCARPDWIESTLVTVDVTGRWTGSWVGTTGSGSVELTLQQRGSIVTGDMKVFGPRGAGPVEGEINGDVLRLRQTNGRWRFDLTVAGDEMTGAANSLGITGSAPLPVKLRRSQ